MASGLTACPMEEKSVNLEDYYYDNHKVILGLAVILQCCLIGNLFVFFFSFYVVVVSFLELKIMLLFPRE